MLPRKMIVATLVTSLKNVVIIVARIIKIFRVIQEKTKELMDRMDVEIYVMNVAIQFKNILNMVTDVLVSKMEMAVVLYIIIIQEIIPGEDQNHIRIRVRTVIVLHVKEQVITLIVREAIFKTQQHAME